MRDTSVILVIATALVLLGVVASKLSARLGVPALLLFLAIGMLAGSDGLGGIAFDDPDLAQAVGVVALAYILFAGGLDTSWPDIRPVLAMGVSLATVGVIATAVVVGVVASVVMDLPLTTGLLLGSIVSSTDAAAVFAVLRSRAVSLRGDLRPLLELESGSNDPMAVFLTIGFLELVVNPGTAGVALVPLFVAQMAIGGAIGLVTGRATAWVLNRLRLEFEGLYPVVTFALVPLTFAITTLAGGSGFLAVYLAGIVLARHDFVHRRSLMRFHNAIAWLSQIGMFLVLGLLVFPSDLLDIAGPGLLVAAALILVARPIGVFLALAPSRLGWRARTMVAWVGLRGAAPIILATFPLMEGAASTDLIFDTVFFIVLTSVLIQGTTIPFMARRLGVAEPLAATTVWPVEPGQLTGQGAGLHELEVPEGSPVAGRALVHLGAPPGTIVVLIGRSGEFIVPQGTTELRGGDQLLVLGPADAVERLRRRLEPRHAGPGT